MLVDTQKLVDPQQFYLLIFKHFLLFSTMWMHAQASIAGHNTQQVCLNMQENESIERKKQGRP